MSFRRDTRRDFAYRALRAAAIDFGKAHLAALGRRGTWEAANAAEGTLRLNADNYAAAMAAEDEAKP